VELKPYVFFYGRCEEALQYYKRIFGGSYEIMRNADAPPDVMREMGQVDRNRVMHSSFNAPGISFFASDGRESKRIDPDEGNVALSITTHDVAEGERLCNALAENGKVQMPFSDAFWGGKFGDVIDRFGNEWMITAPAT
jgi:PhnB protein